MLENLDNRVTVLNKLTCADNLASLEGLAEDRFQFVQGDITDAAVVDGLLADCDVVVHYAAESHTGDSLRDPRRYPDTNIIGTPTLIE